MLRLLSRLPLSLQHFHDPSLVSCASTARSNATATHHVQTASRYDFLPSSSPPLLPLFPSLLSSQDVKPPPLTSDKANVTCIPSTPAPPRRRRRPNQDLRERLARCEELLKHYSNGDVGGEHERLAASAASAPTVATNLPTETSTASPALSESSERQQKGRLVPQEGGERFMDHHAWTSFYDEVSWAPPFSWLVTRGKPG